MREYCRNPEISSEYLNIGRIFKYHPMVLGDLGGMGVGSNARKRGKCQADQCLMGVGGDWDEIGNHWKVYGKKLEISWKGLEKLRGVEWAIWNGSNARSRGKCQADETDGVRYMVFVLKTGKYGSKNDFPIEN